MIMTLSSTEATASSALKIVHRNCPFCDRDNSAEPANRYSSPPWTIRTCSGCGFVYIDTAPEYVHLAVELDWETTYAAEIQRKAKSRKISYKLSRWTSVRNRRFLPQRRVHKFVRKYHSSGRIVDVGCGVGSPIGDLFDSFVPYGVEISTKLAAEADALYGRYGGGAVNAPSLFGLRTFPANYFEAAVMRSYLEHELEPLGVLKEVYRILKTGGIAVVKVPNFGSVNRRVMGRKWCGFRYPDHLNYFSRSTLRKFARSCGFLIEFSFLGSLPTSDNMWAVLTKPR
jgi:SAM-dependent methyltransferase